MAHWTDFFKLFSYAGAEDSLSKLNNKSNLTGAGSMTGDSPNLYGNTVDVGAGTTNLRQTYDMIDTTLLSNRKQRYKEYERLRNIPEIEMAMNLIADEACVSGNTMVATPHGFFSIKKLAEDHKDDRFLVYCWDFEKNDYALGWAYAPRMTKHAKETVCVALDDGTSITATPDHKILKSNGEWIEIGALKEKDELMPFYKSPRNPILNNLTKNQQPRIFTFRKGWLNERQFVDYWKGTFQEDLTYESIKKLSRSNFSIKKIAKSLNIEVSKVHTVLKKHGFTYLELKNLNKKQKCRRVIGVCKGEAQNVYDISVEKHKCFATDSVILHNCQKDDLGNVLKVITKNSAIRKEAEFFLLHRKMQNLNRRAWELLKSLIINGDLFLEHIIDPESPKSGIVKTMEYPPETMYRLETIKGRLLEFQQSNEDPDWKAVEKSPLNGKWTDSELSQSTAIRFAPNQITHIRLGESRKLFSPYGQSLIEPARGPAHSLRLLEDSMIVYRLARAPERRVFYIDGGTLPPAKAEAYLERMKALYRKRKVPTARGLTGNNAVEEKWTPPAVDEDIWVLTRPNAQNKIETLPGASNLGEIDDAVYFRQKLLVSLNLPRNYFSNEDMQATKVSLSSQNANFSRFIERIQGNFEDGMLAMLEIHFQLRGIPEELYEDLRIKMTPPSEWREASRAELTSKRIADASSLKSAKLWSTYDIYKMIFKFEESETQEMLARLKIEGLEEMKSQIIAQNPQMIGVGVPGESEEDNKQELGANPGGPNFNPSGEQPPQENPPPPSPDGGMGDAPTEEPQPTKKKHNHPPLPDVSEDDLEKYDLEIQNYESEMDKEDVDRSFGND